MPVFVLGFLVLSALFHAGWNLLLKNTDKKFIIMWWGVVLGSILGLPILILHWPVPARIWPFALGSALFETLYEAVLTSAYQKEDFSVVYPIARGGAPALLAVWAILFLKQTPGLGGTIGLLILIVGLMIVGSSKWLSESKKGVWSAAGIGLACLVALMISIYSVIDGAAVKLMDAASYSVLLFVLNAIFVIPVIAKLYGWQAILEVGRMHWRQVTAIGLLDIGSFMLVLISYALAPVAYVGAIREIGIVFGALAGWLWLKESFGRVRAVGAAIIFAGILTILLAG
jgi:drug/metabolite transporter (DMT)-like permease